MELFVFNKLGCSKVAISSSGPSDSPSSKRSTTSFVFIPPRGGGRGGGGAGGMTLPTGRGIS